MEKDKGENEAMAKHSEILIDANLKVLLSTCSTCLF